MTKVCPVLTLKSPIIQSPETSRCNPLMVTVELVWTQKMEASWLLLIEFVSNLQPAHMIVD
jgi:hypothetical protein